jgi:superfamily II DNA or RNA helicase
MTSKHTAHRHLLNRGIFENLTTFAELENRISGLDSNKARGDAFEIFAEAYLATQKIALAREVWPFESIPLEQRRRLSLNTGRDMGVDGIYETTDGELRAYQVKFRSRRPALTWEELSTFMGLTDQVSQRVLFTNCDTLPSLMQDRNGFVAIRGSDLDRLTPEDFAAMREWLHSGRVELERKQPRPHQDEALASIASGLAANDRATVVMACGTGKSLVALWAAERHASKTLLVLLPSLALVRQLLHEWLRETSWEQFSFMCVCSDPTVAKGADDLVVHQADLDFPVTTDSAVVRRYLSKPFNGTRIVFSTYQSAQVVADGMPVDAEGMRQPFDLGVFDEAHKTASRDGTRFSFALEDSNLPIRQRLFFTATPRHYDVRKKDKEGDNTLVYSMDRPEVYGPVVHTLSFAEAARRGIICDYKVVISVVTSAMVDDHLLKKGEVIVGGDAVKARQVALQVALQKAVEKYGVSRIFTFHGSVKAARSFTSDDSEGIAQHLPDFNTLHVSGEMPTARREDQMKAFRQADKAVMSNARCLTEGVDVPAVDMVAFISPRKSKVDIVQATGRAMRKSPGKEFGYVMVPLFVEQAANESIEDALKRTGFDDVWDLLGAMREQDDVLVDIIRQMQEDKGRTGGYNDSRFSERIEVLGPSVSLETIRESITAECLDSLGVSWDVRFGELQAYKARCGSTNVPLRLGGNLGVWVVNQRVLNKKRLISSARVDRLNEIGFEWDTLESKWSKMFQELVEFKMRNGHVDVPINQDSVLGNWVSNQRKNFKSCELELSRKKLLDDVGFIWDVNDSKWERSISELGSYFAHYGNTNVPVEWPGGLGTWVSQQRKKKKNNLLTKDQIRNLDNLKFDWDRLDSTWNEMLTELIAYKTVNGHVNVPQRPSTVLGRWVRGQRDSMRLGRLTADQQSRLEEVGFEWDMLDAKWESMFQELLDYSEKHGNTNVPSDWPTYLGTWVGLQRRAFKSLGRGKISSIRKEKLDAIGFIWDAADFSWNEKLAEFESCVAVYGSADASINWPSGLGDWVSRQRSMYAKGDLAQARIEKLESAGFIWDLGDLKWEAMFDELSLYKMEFQHANVPQSWPTKLGRWVATQRSLKKDGRLSEERLRRLNELGFTWSLNKIA